MKKSKLVCSILAMLFGVFMVVFGGIDDSPGAQLLGLGIFIFIIIYLVKSRKENTEK